MHLIIPFASISSALSSSVNSEAAGKFLQDLKLPNLRQLLSTLTLVDSDIGAEESFSPPHERALARAQGLPVVDGYIPWAAQKALSLVQENAKTTPWSFVTHCHSVVGMGSMTMEDPAQLSVSEAESRQLFDDMKPYFLEDGLTLHYLEPKLWLCGGQPLRDVRTASFDRVIGKNLSDWQPAGGESAKLRRLQNEMQMLLYTHTVNDARSRSNAAVINSVYFHGNGEFNDQLLSGSGQVSANITTNIETSINMPRSLADAALKEDWPAWTKAWEQLDATVCADLLKRVQAGEADESVVLTLCGERSALTYELKPKSALERLKANLKGFFDLQSSYLPPKTLLKL
jgi:hypothetical protein